MKLLPYSLAVLASISMLASCSSDDPEQVPLNADGAITFSVQLPAELATRANDAFGLGTKAKYLTYAVYDDAGTLVVTNQGNSQKQVQFDSQLKASFTETLVRGVNYKVAFWADATDNTTTPTDPVYTFDATNGKVTVNYDKMTGFTEDYDAFYTVEDAVGGQPAKDVTLYRPLAQINLGTNDLTQGASKFANGVYTTTTISNVCNTLNLVDGTKSFVGTPAAVTVSAQTPNPSATAESFPVAGYDYLAMSYVLTNEALSEVTYSFYTDATAGSMPVNTVTVENVPIKSNYKTNIYGNMLTDETQYNVTINPAFEGDVPVVVPTTIVSNAAELATALATGGTYKVTANVGKIDLNAAADNKELVLVLASEVGNVVLPSNKTKQITLMVGNGVPYPTFEFPSATGFVLKNFSLIGVPASLEKCTGVNFYSSTVNVKNPQAPVYTYGLENVVVDGVPFDGGGVNFTTMGNATNLKVRNCVFDNLTQAGVKANPFKNASDYVENVVITNNVMNCAAATKNYNGIDIFRLKGTNLIEDNKINNPKCIGIYVLSGENLTVQNNSVKNAGMEGIKIQGYNATTGNANQTLGTLLIDGNQVSAIESGIRVARANFTGADVTVKNNALNMSGSTTASNGILLDNTYGPAAVTCTLNVFNNVKVGQAPADFVWFNMINFTGATITGNYAAPF